MTTTSQAAREISYAHSATTRAGRVMIRAMENATGRLRLIRRARGYEQEVAHGRDFWQVMADRYRLSLNVVGGSLDNIPREGPLVLVANHPFGILDGLMMGLILSQTRGDFRILAHRVFQKSRDLDRVLLPISFDGDRIAVQLNLETRKTALAYLGQGGAIGIFPGGTVSTSARLFSEPRDPVWRAFTAKMISKSPAKIVPVYFSGQNSRLFQVASHLHSTLRLGLLIKEFGARVDAPVDVVIGAPIPAEKLKEFRGDQRALMDFLRTETYRLSPQPLRSLDYGFEFEDRYKR